MNPRESLYSSLRFGNDDKTVTMVLKSWKWSDGAPVTSRDFTFVYNLLKVNYQNWAFYIPGQFPTDVSSVTAQGPHTVVLSLTQPTSPALFAGVVLNNVQLVPQHAWDKESDGRRGRQLRRDARRGEGGLCLPAEGRQPDRHLHHQPAVEGGRRAVDAVHLQQRRHLVRLRAEQALLRHGPAPPG